MIKILLVDDSKFFRNMMERVLIRAGYAVCSVGDGEQALEAARQKPPDLILLDMMLPKISGPDVLKKLKQDPSTASIPVVALTGLSGRNAARVKEDGAIAFLEKSDLELEKSPDKLLKALYEIVGRVPSPAQSSGSGR